VPSDGQDTRLPKGRRKSIKKGRLRFRSQASFSGAGGPESNTSSEIDRGSNPTRVLRQFSALGTGPRKLKTATLADTIVGCYPTPGFRG